MTLAAGSRLGPYEILGPLGAGGMGEVYKARDTRLGRTVAIKVLPAFAAANPDRRRRFEHEARAASALEHPNICGLHDIGCETPTHPSQPDVHGGPLHFLVMEFVDGQIARRPPAGGSAADDPGARRRRADRRRARRRPRPRHRPPRPEARERHADGAERDAAREAARLRPGQAAARRRWTRPSGPPTDREPGPLDRPGDVPRHLAYMAPEQLEGKEADARTDVFAFGCVLYEMLTGRRAFAGESEASVISVDHVRQAAADSLAAARDAPRARPARQRLSRQGPRTSVARARTTWPRICGASPRPTAGGRPVPWYTPQTTSSGSAEKGRRATVPLAWRSA